MSKPDYAPPLAPAGGEVEKAQQALRAIKNPAASPAPGSAEAASVSGAPVEGARPAAGWHMPPHETHADPLLDCLVQLVDFHAEVTH